VLVAISFPAFDDPEVLPLPLYAEAKGIAKPATPFGPQGEGVYAVSCLHDRGAWGRSREASERGEIKTIFERTALDL
jgi:hypothetical protein